MKVVITKIGLTKIALSTIDKPLKLTHFAVGDGGGKPIEPNKDMTRLVNEKYRDFVSNSYSNENNLVIECVLRSDIAIEKGFKIFELGIFDEAGELIAIAQTPEQYRPSHKEGIVTEWIASVVLQIDNTANIKIEVPQTVFATVGALKRLIDRVEILEQNKLDLITSSVGIEKWFNTDDRYRNKNIVRLGIKTYALMDNTNILSIKEYPLLFKNINAVDRGDGTFAMPNFYNGTLRHISKDSSRNLGSFEDCAIQSHNHIMTHNHKHEHQHNLPDITGQIDYVTKGGNQQFFGAFRVLCRYPSWLRGTSNPDDWSAVVGFSSHAAGIRTTGGVVDHSYQVWTSMYEGTTKDTGIEETRMKNTAGQWYLLAKVNI